MPALALFLACALAPPPSLAAGRESPLSAHEEHVGAQEEQVCSVPQLDFVARWLELPRPPADAPDTSFGRPVGTIVAAACQPRPGEAGTSLVAVAWQADPPDPDDDGGAKALLIAVVDEARGGVLASRRETIVEDAGARVDAGSLWIDTAAYVLAPGVRAFGADFTSGYIPHCNDGFTGASRTLYVQDGATIRPISTPLEMSSWQVLKRHDRCGNDPGPTVTEYDVKTISVAPTSTNGWHDLIVTSTGTHEEESDDGPRHARSTGRSQVRWVYAGGRYGEAAAAASAHGRPQGP